VAPLDQALLVIDVRPGAVSERGRPRRRGVLSRIDYLVATARDKNVPVVWVRHSDDELTVGSADWEICA
jgi:nicotinamidase-related amidase